MGDLHKPFTFRNRNIDFYEKLAPYYQYFYADLQPELVVSQWVDLLEKLGYIPATKTTHDKETLHLIDIGCGYGQYISEWNRLGFKVSGLDSSGEMLKLAMQQLQNCSPPGYCDLLQADIRIIEGSNWSSRFDFAVSHFNFLNLFAPNELKNVFAGVRKLLKPGGFWVTDFCEAFDVLADFNEIVEIRNSNAQVCRSRQRIQEDGSYILRFSGQDIEGSEQYWLNNSLHIIQAAKETGFDFIDSFEWLSTINIGNDLKDGIRQLLVIFHLNNEVYDK